jgi:hypothetical protein
MTQGDLQMDHAITGKPAETILYGALELSKNSWLLALQFYAQPSLYPIRGGDTEGLMAKLMAARDRWAKVTGNAPSIVWLARFLKARGIECLVVDAVSMRVNRRARRAKTDRIDVGMLLRALIAWGQGDRHVWSVVRVPSVDEETSRSAGWYRAGRASARASAACAPLERGRNRARAARDLPAGNARDQRCRRQSCCHRASDVRHGQNPATATWSITPSSSSSGQMPGLSDSPI